MRVSCCAYSFRQYLQGGQMTLESFLNKAVEIGFDGVELTAYYFPQTDRAYLNDLKRLAHRKGLLVSGTATGTDFTQTDSEKRAAHVRMAREWIERSVILGAPTMRVFAGPVREGVTEDQAFQWCVECLQECAEKAQQEGVVLALENHGGLTATADGTLRLLEAAGSDWVGLNVDFGNFAGKAYTQFSACAPHAVATHAKLTFRAASGPEVVDYARVRQILDRAGYRGYIAMEYEEAEDPMTGVPRFAQDLFAALRA